jgi:stage V sporulation protein SpoVS
VKYLVLIFSSIIFFTSCKTSKIITKAIAPKDSTQIVIAKNIEDSIKIADEARSLLAQSHIDFNTFSATAKVEIETAKGRQPDLSVKIKMQKDSAIWISISATIFNAEVFRAIITKDSVKLLNKREKEVQLRSIDYLTELTNIPFDLNTLQNLLLGNAVFFDSSKAVVKKFTGYMLIASLTQDFKNLTTFSTVKNSIEHIKIDDLDLMQNRTADFSFDNFEVVDGRKFAMERQIIASEKSKLVVQMQFKQVEFNKELSISFSIPKGYKRN